jgi:pyruvate/2-oxoglutarate dehydrogenase complex dihydrolipoamide acyltransferase (E2) component
VFAVANLLLSWCWIFIRFSLYMLFGSTKQRRRQVSRRRQILDEHFLKDSMAGIHVTTHNKYHATPMSEDGR